MRNLCKSGMPVGLRGFTTRSSAPSCNKSMSSPLSRWRLAALLLTPLLMNISVSVTFPVMGMAVCFTMLAVTKLLVRGKALKDDNDLFV